MNNAHWPSCCPNDIFIGTSFKKTVVLFVFVVRFIIYIKFLTPRNMYFLGNPEVYNIVQHELASR